MTRLAALAIVIGFMILGSFFSTALSQTRDDTGEKTLEQAKQLKKLNELVIKLQQDLADRNEKLLKVQDDFEAERKQLQRKIAIVEAERKEIDDAFIRVLRAEEDRRIADAKAPISPAKPIDLLRQTIDVRGLQEKVKLKRVLEYLSDQTSGRLVMLADREAFSEDQDPYEEEVVLPGIASKMSLNQALRMITAQIGNGQATFVVRQSHVEITTQERATAPRILQSTIVASFERRSLKDVLDQLADDGGLDVHLDPNVGKTADTLITAKFRNVSLESALVTVTEMAELKFVTMDRSVFVTTPEKANGLRIEERERAKSRKELDSKVPPKAKNLEPPAR